MKKEYRRRRDESLAQWIERIVPAMQGRSYSEMHEMVTAVSKESYLAGVEDERFISTMYR